MTTDIHQRSIAGVTVLHRAKWDQPLVMNAALHNVWVCLEFGGSVAEITDDILDVFGLARDQVIEDVELAFTQLADLGLIEPVERNIPER